MARQTDKRVSTPIDEAVSMESETICPVCNKPVSEMEPAHAGDGKAVHSACLAKPASENAQAEAIPEELNDTLWSIGWQFGLTCFFSILFATTAIYISGSFYGAAASLMAIYPWLKGTRLINKNWNHVYNIRLRQAENIGAKALKIDPGEADIFHLTYGSGKAINVVPNRRYRLTLLYVGEKSLAIFDDARIDMVNRELVSRESRTRELRYQDIKSINYSKPYCMIQTASGEQLSFQSRDSEEEPAIEAIRKKLFSP